MGVKSTEVAIVGGGQAGYPIQRRGMTSVKGLYVLGLDWLHNAKSGLFAGMGDDATCLASVFAARS